ncbi:16S rRNA (guanine(966)-N(2))-methyltransferase RsmD [Paenibacillus sp. y28]|uniref:16S rRNA (guanine(966)-N(2))-methyltransferase RsmD n=1 Tax=Paenibacillus sp. y28 TaxID=3129110 RepID=UPI00301ABAB3
MRVIAGTAKGTPLKAVPGMSTRPTTDKVKEAVFSMIGPYFDGGQALDLFAGTGGLGIEALSRGIDKAVFIDIEAKSVEVIRANLKASRVESRAEVYRNEAGRALKILARRGAQFDLVFLDPPYRMTIVGELLTALQEQQLLSERAVLVVEQAAETELESQIGGLVCRKRAEYGEIAIWIYEWGNQE